MKQQLVPVHNEQAGYAMVVLMVFVIMALTLISAAVNVMLITTQETSQEELSQTSLRLAETGVEEALLRSLRNPSYSGGTLNIDGDTITIAVSGNGIKTIESRASVGVMARFLRVTADYTGAIFQIPSWVVQY